MTSDDHVIGAEHVSDLESVCLATRKGDILLYNTHSKDVCTHNSHYHIKMASSLPAHTTPTSSLPLPCPPPLSSQRLSAWAV